MGRRKIGALHKLEADLANLQYKIRADPPSYKEEFQVQYHQYATFRELFMRNPASSEDNGIVSFREQIDFVSHVADSYPDLTADFPHQLIELLTQHHEHLEAELCEKVVSSLVLLRNRHIIESVLLLNTFFPLLVKSKSKPLRALLYQKIISDIRAANAKTTNHPLNRTAQNILYSLVTSDRSSRQAIWAVRIARELWRRRIWSDSKTVEIVKEACLADHEKVATAAVRFFLTGDKDREEAPDDDMSDDDVDFGRIRHQIDLNKKSKRREHELKRATASVKRRERKKKRAHPLDFSALHLLHSPDDFTEALFAKHLNRPRLKLSLDQKLLSMQLVSRLIGAHKLIIDSFYVYILKYLTPRQTSVTTFLASLAQATHTHVPPELLEPPVRKIANDFVTEAVASEVAAAGLNAIREICTRQPLALDDVLLQDLVMYRTSKDKGVMMAARGLLSLYRSVAPQMLKKKDLGREAALNMRAQVKEQRRFGESNAGGIEGIELLEQWKADERRKMREERLARGEEQPGGSKAGSGTDSEVEKEDNWKEWQVQDDSDSDDSGGWLDVPNDDEIDVKFSDDSGDDKPPAAKKRKGDENENGMTAPLNTNGTPKETNGGNEEEEGSKTAENKTGMDGSFATRHILTPSDLAKLKQLRAEAAVKSLLPFAKRSQKQVASTIRRHIGYDEHEDDTVITAERIEAAASLSRRVTKEDKLIAAGKQVPLKADGQYEYERGSTVTGGTGLGSRKDRPEEKHRRLGKAARKAERKREAGKSSTNREKARKKNVLMTLSKARVKMKKGSGGRLVHKSRALRGTGRGKGKR